MSKSPKRRLFLLGAVKTSAMLCLVSRLYYLQVVKNQQYRALSANNRMKVSLINPNRGNILSSTGTKLAYNEKKYDLIFEPLRGLDIKHSVAKLLYILELSQAEYHNLYNLISNAQGATVILEDISWRIVKKIEFNLIDLPEVFIVTNYKRHYLLGPVMAHVIGYARRNYQNGLNLYVGSSGVEYACNQDLEGAPGIKQEEINAKMQVVRSLSRIVSTTGNDVTLSINHNLQQFVYGILRSSGSVIVIDVNNGNVLCMNSFPSYDNNMFVKSLTQKQWNDLKNDKELPMFHRALALQIPPGSTFKMISALAALESGVITSHTTFFCSGKIKIGNNIFRCWKKHGHGKISLNEAISSSCNVYFYYIAQVISINHLCDIASRFGFGKLTGIGLKEELSGLIPNPTWRKKNNKYWYVGDTVNSVIGHGFVLSTPLQLAVMVSRLAVGKQIIPSIKHITQDSVDFVPIEINQNDLNIIKRGMYSAVNSSTGTANKVYSNFQKIAGKTGTSQVKRMVNGEKIEDNHSLFVGYAPYDKPKYAISVVMERSMSGSASKIAKKVFDYMYMCNL